MSSEELLMLREQLGWTHKRIADELGVSKYAVDHWFRTDGSAPISEPALRLLRLLAEKERA
jgi:transcriptional regulator with XRE-family HTH domain